MVMRRISQIQFEFITRLLQRRSQYWNGELALLLLLFAQLRLFFVFFVRPGGELYDGTTDFRFYFRMAELSTAGYYPYLHYWVEYPPIFPWIIVAIYRLSLLLPAWPDEMVWFQVGLGSVLSAFDLGNLILVYLIGKALHGPQIGLRAAWIYALLFFPMYVTVTWYDTMPLFFLLLTAWLTVQGRARLAGVAAGIGFMVKIIPILAVPTALRGLHRTSERIGYIISAAVAAVVIAAPFMIGNFSMFLASMVSIAARPSWETLWALLEGYHNTGLVVPLGVRFDPQTAAYQIHPSTLPWPLINGIFLLICFVLYIRKLSWSAPRTQLVVLALTLNLFLLFSKGYSPQFMVYVLALLVIVFPGFRGVFYAIILTMSTFFEYPWTFGIFRMIYSLQWLNIGIRTGLLLCLSIEYSRLLFADSAPVRVKQGLAMTRNLALAAALVAFGVGMVQITRQYYREPQDAVALARYIRASDLPDPVNISSSRTAFYRISPLLTSKRWMIADDEWDSWPFPVEQRLAEIALGQPLLWVIIDHNKENAPLQQRLLGWLDKWGSRAGEAWFDKYELIRYSSNAQ